MTVSSSSYPPPFNPAWRQGAVPRWRMSRKMRRTLITVGLLCTSLPCMGSFHHRSRARESECTNNLKSLFTGLRTQQSLDDTVTLDRIGFSPERGNRYAYFLAPGPMEDRSAEETTNVVGNMGVGVDIFRHKAARNLTLKDLPLHLARLAGPRGTAPNLEFIALCAGDIDNEPMDTPDIWSIATMDRVIDGEPIAAGELFRHVNDNTTD